ncbi:MAG: glycosyltransferase family 2 protein [Smithellaceae bacterium]|nr:glycosyltransferase family 2 protein [Smithellaceae bacterium]
MDILREKDGLPEVSIIIPAKNEERGIAKVVAETVAVMNGTARSYEIIVVDDGSDDGTASRARGAGASIVSHPYNIGNGAAIKTGIRKARGEILVMLDGDGQHSPYDIPLLLEKMNSYDMVVGARTSGSQSSAHRALANGIYNGLASYICGRRIDDLTSGFRAIRAQLARQFVYLLPNTFSYPTTITLSVIHSGHSLAYVPIKTERRIGKSKINLLSDGTRFLLIILRIATLFSPMKIFLPVSSLLFLSGMGYGLCKIFLLHERYGPTASLLIIMSIIVFMVGLVSEQVAQLRFDRSEFDHSGGS